MTTLPNGGKFFISSQASMSRACGSQIDESWPNSLVGSHRIQGIEWTFHTISQQDFFFGAGGSRNFQFVSRGRSRNTEFRLFCRISKKYFPGHGLSTANEVCICVEVDEWCTTVKFSFDWTSRACGSEIHWLLPHAESIGSDSPRDRMGFPCYQFKGTYLGAKKSPNFQLDSKGSVT